MPRWVFDRHAWRWPGLVLALSFAVVVSILALQQSAARGRLSALPAYDDVSYMIDAGRRVNQLYESGLWSTVGSLLAKPPHSPYATAAAMTGFLLFGMHDWAPYVVNSIAMIVFYGVLAYLTRGMSLWLRFCTLLAVTPIPLVSHGVQQFRPDFLSAVLTSFGVLLLVWDRVIERPIRRILSIGALFGLAVLVKPTAFPATLVMLGAGWLLAAAGYVARQRRSGMRATVLAGFGLLGGFLLVAGPFLLIDRGATLGYILFHTRGPGAVNWTHYAAGDALRFYLDGAGGDFMLGPYAYGLLMVLAVVGVLSGIHATPAERYRAFSVQVMLLLAFLICTAAPKHLFFGLQFQVLLVLDAVGVLRRAIVGGDRGASRSPLSVGVLLALTAASVAGFRFPDSRAPYGSERVRVAWNLHDRLYQKIVSLVPDREAMVLLTFTGDVSSANLEYSAVKDGRSNRIISWPLAQTPATYNTWLRDAVLVVAIQSGTHWSYEAYLSNKILDETITALDRDKRFQRVDEMTVPDSDRRIFFYQRTQ